MTQGNMFNPSRDEARNFFIGVWQKHGSGAPLTDIERTTLAILLDHPEYHEHLRQPERYLEQDWHPEQGQTNPFLHLMMHLFLKSYSVIWGLLFFRKPMPLLRNMLQRRSFYRKS